MLICSYFKVFFITLYVQNCNFSQKNKKQKKQNNTGWLDGNADLKCKMFALSLTSQTSNT